MVPTLPTQRSAAAHLPAVTVVVTVWGEHVRHLPGTLASIAAQEGVEVRVVVVDNASEAEVALPPLPVQVSVVRSWERLSPGAARNLGLAAVRTDLVCFADADDLLLPGLLSRAVAALADPEVVVAGASLRHVDGETLEPTGQSWPGRAVRVLAPWPTLLASWCLVVNCVPVTGGAVCRTEAVRGLGGFGDVEVNDDWTLSPLLALEGRVVVTEEAGVLYRVWARSQSRRARPPEHFRESRAELRSRFAAHPRRPWWAALALRVARHRHETALPELVTSAALEDVTP